MVHIKMIPKVKPKVANWNPKDTTSEPNANKMHQQINVFLKTRLGRSATKALVPFWHHVVDFSIHFGARSPLQVYLNQPPAHKIIIFVSKRCLGRRLEKKRTLVWMFDANMVGVKKQKQAFRIIRVAIEEFPLDHEI